LRDRRTVPYQLYVDRDEIPDEIIRAVNNRENIPHLSFAPLPPEVNPETNREYNHQAIPAGEESEEESESTGESSGRLSDDSIITYDLDGHTTGIPPGLLRAWEANAEIRRDEQIQTSPLRLDSPGSFSGYSPPNYSPVRPGEFEFDPVDISPAEEGLTDQTVNHILDYLNSEEFLGTVNDIYRT